MSNPNHKLVVAVITQHDAKVWADGLEPGTAPVVVHPPSEDEHRHVRTGEHSHGHHTDSANPVFFEAVVGAIGSAGHLLLIGHGHGKSSEVDRFKEFLDKKHRNLAAAVAADLHLNLQGMTEPEVLKAAREWWAGNSKSGMLD